MEHLQGFKTKKAYSLLELIVSLAIVAIATVVMVNFLVLSLKISIISLGRSYVREEVSNIVILMSRDLRNSENVVSINCSSPFNGSCEVIFVRSGQRYRWKSCLDSATNRYRMCKEVWSSTASDYVTEFKSSDTVNIDYFNVSYGFAEGYTGRKVNIIVTLSASHRRNDLNVNDVVRQTTISNRNYEF